MRFYSPFWRISFIFSRNVSGLHVVCAISMIDAPKQAALKIVCDSQSMNQRSRVADTSFGGI
jgi:hypothetical protein